MYIWLTKVFQSCLIFHICTSVSPAVPGYRAAFLCHPGDAHAGQTYSSSLMSMVHSRLYFKPVLCANDRPPKTSLISHGNSLRHAVIHHHAWLTSQLKSSSEYQAPVSSCSFSFSLSLSRLHECPHEHAHSVGETLWPHLCRVGWACGFPWQRPDWSFPQICCVRKTCTNYCLVKGRWYCRLWVLKT